MIITSAKDCEEHLSWKPTVSDLFIYDETITNNPYILLKPYPLQKLSVLLSNKVTNQHNNLLLGGGGGGGKTTLLTGLALQYIQEKNYKCLVVRKNYKDLVAVGSIFENIKEWNSTLPRNKQLKINNSSPIKVQLPGRGEIRFLAFDREEMKYQTRGEQFHRIIVDEATLIEESILRFLYRSLRKPIDDPIPLSMIYASNPQGTSHQYVYDNYVSPEGQYPYCNFDFRHNPYLDTEQYLASLNMLPKIDRLAQMGSWETREEEGLLIDGTDFDEVLIQELPCESLLNIVSVDFASTGKDSTALTSICYGSNGKYYLVDSLTIPDAHVESLLLEFLHKQVTEYDTYCFVMELEPGSASEYSSRYWEDLIREAEPSVAFTTEKPTKSKFERSRLTARLILQKQLYILEDSNSERLRTEFLTIHPDKKVMSKRKSPDLLDSVNQGVYLVNSMI